MIEKDVVDKYIGVKPTLAKKIIEIAIQLHKCNKKHGRCQGRVHINASNAAGKIASVKETIEGCGIYQAFNEETPRPVILDRQNDIRSELYNQVVMLCPYCDGCPSNG